MGVPVSDNTTARPWQVMGHFPRGIKDGNGITVATTEKVERGRADAALIVRAVNDHDVLVAVAEAAEAGVLAWEAKCAELAPGKDPWGMATPESRALVAALAVWRERKEQR